MENFTWCEWDGSAGINGQSDSRGYILINNIPTRTPAVANSKGWYKVIITQPIIGEDQDRDAEVWGFTGTEITKTWTVRDLTDQEKDQRTASPMPLSEYYLWYALLAKGVITTEEAVAALPPELVAAYEARDRLENT